MGHRGLVGWYVDGQGKAAYSHWGSYPDGNGLTMLHHLRKVDENGQWPLYREAVKRLEVITDEEAEVTQEHLKALGDRYLDAGVGVSGRLTYYQLLRDTQGDPDKMLDAGLIVDSWSFGDDSLFNEGSVIVVLDGDGELQWYDGFQEKGPVTGLWAKPDGWKPEPNYPGGPIYWPITLRASWPLSQLPTDEEFLAATASKES